jgi:hypothetical protein
MPASQEALQVREIAPVKGLLQVGVGESIDLNAYKTFLSTSGQTMTAFLAKRKQFDAVINTRQPSGQHL